MIENSRWNGERVTLICDGTPSSEANTGTRYQIVFTGPTKSADDEIIERVESSTAPKSILVVTSDREIVTAIRKRGAQQIGSSAFLLALVKDSQIPKSKKTQRPTGLSPKLAQEWKEHFGIDDKAMEELQNAELPKFGLRDQTEKETTESTNIPKPKSKSSVKLNNPTLPDDILEEARRLLEDQ
jgi:predicted RNA-binding protein with PIN domain